MKRPTVVVVFGVLNIIVFAFSVFGLIANAVAEKLAEKMHQPNPALDALAAHPGVAAYTNASLWLGVVAGIAALVGGIGLLGMKQWGRKWSIGYAVYALASCVVGLFLNVTVLLPEMMKQMEGKDDAFRAGAIGGMIGGILGGVACGLGYPIALLVVVRGRKVVEAFAAAAAGGPPAVP